MRTQNQRPARPREQTQRQRQQMCLNIYTYIYSIRPGATERAPLICTAPVARIYLPTCAIYEREIHFYRVNDTIAARACAKRVHRYAAHNRVDRRIFMMTPFARASRGRSAALCVHYTRCACAGTSYINVPGVGGKTCRRPRRRRRRHRHRVCPVHKPSHVSSVI